MVDRDGRWHGDLGSLTIALQFPPINPVISKTVADAPVIQQVIRMFGRSEPLQMTRHRRDNPANIGLESPAHHVLRDGTTVTAHSSEQRLPVGEGTERNNLPINEACLGERELGQCCLGDFDRFGFGDDRDTGTILPEIDIPDNVALVHLLGVTDFVRHVWCIFFHRGAGLRDVEAKQFHGLAPGLD
ncbi:hypothetical protein ACI514_09920 [Pseudomonas sp. M20]|uniref:hypothetical protein n=1 Tax=Pseudomonas sp. M20 TaxID=3379129 RepID=UPI00386EE2E7